MMMETEVLGEDLPQCHFVHHKPHMLCPDANPGRRGGKPATNRWSYGTAKPATKFVERYRSVVSSALNMEDLISNFFFFFVNSMSNET
jgi:hypothetical protein